MVQYLEDKFQTSKENWETMEKRLFCQQSKQLQQSNSNISFDRASQTSNYNKKELLKFKLLHNQKQKQQIVS